MTKCECDKCHRIDALELERLAPVKTELTPQLEFSEPAPAKKAAGCKRCQNAKPMTEDERSLYFNAGRYSAGARDKSATRAYEELIQRGEA